MIDMILKPIRSLLRLNPLKPKVEIKCEADECVLVMDKKDEIFSVEDIYTPLSVAKEEIWRRWNDKELRKKVEDFLGGDLPEVLKNEPRAILTRQISTPNKEFFQFFDMASISNLKPLGWEYHADCFTTTNRDKACLAKLGFLNGFDKKIDPIINYKKVIDLTGKEENRKFTEIKTIWGEGFIDFHHRLLASCFPSFELYDASDWYKSSGKNAKEYYPYFLALFLRNGILFENFNLNGYEKSFTRNIVMPALEKINEIFGIKPMIVKITSDEDVDNIILSCYPHKMCELLINKQKNE